MQNKTNLKKGIIYFIVILIIYLLLPILFILFAHLIIYQLKIGENLILGVIIIGISNAISFFFRGYYPPKTLPHILGNLGFCIFNGIFFMFWLIVGKNIEISNPTHIAKANLGILAQLFVWTLIGTSIAFILELLYFYKKIKNYKIIKNTKLGFLIINIISISLLGLLIYQISMTRYSIYTSKIYTNYNESNRSYSVEVQVNLLNQGLFPICDGKIYLNIYVEESDFYNKGYLLGSNITYLKPLYGGNNYYISCKANTKNINNNISINLIRIEILFYGTCLGAYMNVITNLIFMV